MTEDPDVGPRTSDAGRSDLGTLASTVVDLKVCRLKYGLMPAVRGPKPKTTGSIGSSLYFRAR